jgi:hypothetical protein
MMKRTALRLYALIPALLVLVASPARAQFTPTTLEDPATGETYHVEASFDMWHPGSEMTLSSEALGIPGSAIDFKRDLGLTNRTFREIRTVLKASKRNKFRFEFIPIKFEQESVLTRDVVFQGQRYRVGVPVNSQLDWKAYRFAYELDFISRNRGFVGMVLEAKYTEVTAALQSPINYERVKAKAPIPAIGGIGRIYIVPNISITGELTDFKIPDRISEDYKGHYLDLNIYGTVNFTNNVGAQMGYRSFDLGYTVRDNNITTDAGSFVLKGLYFGAVARF